MGNTQVFCHRIPAVASLLFASCGLLFSALGGAGCNFLIVRDSSSAHGNFIPGLSSDAMTEHIFLPVSVGIGPICTSHYYSRSKDVMWNASKGFFISSLITGSIAAITFCAISYVIPPTDRKWKCTSVMSAISAVLQVPIFLLMESQPCTMDENHSCKLSSGAFLLICSIICYVFATVTTQCSDTPRWALERNAWRVKDGEEDEWYLDDDEYDDHDEEAGHFPSFYDREAAKNENMRKMMLAKGHKSDHFGGGMWGGWKRWWDRHRCHVSTQDDTVESEANWEYDGGGQRVGTRSMPLGVTKAEPDGKVRSLPTDGDTYMATEEHSYLSKERHQDEQEMQHSQQSAARMLPLQQPLHVMTQQANISGMAAYNTEEMESRLFLQVDPRTGLPIESNLKQGHIRKESEATTLDDVASLDSHVRLAEQERAMMASRSLESFLDQGRGHDGKIDSKYDEEMYFGDDDRGENDSVDEGMNLPPPSVSGERQLAPPSIDGGSLKSSPWLTSAIEDDKGDSSYSSAPHKHVEMKEAAVAATSAAAMPMTKPPLPGAGESATMLFISNQSKGRMSSAMKWLMGGRTSSLQAHAPLSEFGEGDQLSGKDVEQHQSNMLFTSYSSPPNSMSCNMAGREGPILNGGSKEAILTTPNKKKYISSPREHRSFATSPTKTMTTANSAVTSSPIKKNLMSSVRAIFGGNTSPNPKKGFPKNIGGNKNIDVAGYENISDRDVTTDQENSIKYQEGGDRHQAPSYSEESSAALRGEDREIIEPWLVEEQSDPYVSSAEEDDLLLMPSPSHQGNDRNNIASPPQCSSEQLSQDEQHIEPFADWKELNDAMAAGLLAASESNNDTKIISLTNDNSSVKEELDADDPELQFYSSGDDTPSDISISTDNGSLPEREIPIDGKQMELATPFADLSGTDDDNDSKFLFSTEEKDSAVAVGGVKSRLDQGGKVSRALSGKSSIKRRRRRRRKTPDRDGSGSICSRGSLLDTTIDEETDQEMKELLSDSESDGLTASSAPLIGKTHGTVALSVDHCSLNGESDANEPCLIVSPSISGKDEETVPERGSYEEGYLSRVILNASNSAAPLSVHSSSVSSKLSMISSIANSVKKSDYKAMPDDISDDVISIKQEGNIAYVTCDSSNGEKKNVGTPSSLRRQRLVRSASMPAARRKRSQVHPVSSDDDGSRISMPSHGSHMKSTAWRDDRLNRSIHCPIDDGSAFQSSESSGDEKKDDGGAHVRRRSISNRKRGVSVSGNARSARIRRLQREGSSHRRSRTCDPPQKQRSGRSKVLVYIDTEVDASGLIPGPEEASV